MLKKHRKGFMSTESIQRSKSIQKYRAVKEVDRNTFIQQKRKVPSVVR